MQEVYVACPCCKNKRLFDADPEAVEGIIKIKCPTCKGGNSSQLPYEKGSDRANRRMSYIIATKAWRSIGEYISILLPGFFVFMCVLS